jgi:hypothetical protein
VVGDEVRVGPRAHEQVTLLVGRTRDDRSFDAAEEVAVHHLDPDPRTELPGKRRLSRAAAAEHGDAPHYAAAKGAIHAFTKSLAVEAAPHGIRVNCVAPGPTDTPLMTPELRDPDYVASLVLGRLVAPEEIAAAVRFVLRGEHNLVGQVISPNAGAVV